MSRLAWGWLLGAIVLVGVVTPAPARASATAGTLTLSPGTQRFEAGFSARGSNGFSVHFDISRRFATLSTVKLDSLKSVVGVTYEARGRMSAEHIHVRFGNRGRISIVFKPNGKVIRKDPPRRCRGKPRATAFGAFVGTIRFRGEHGYTAIDRSSARGTLRSSPRWRCKRDKPPPSRHVKEPEFELPTVLDARSARSDIMFSALATRPLEERGSTSFVVASNARQGSMRVSRFAFVSAKESAFVFDEALDTATVTPPSPFAGTATFQRNSAGSARWSGSLSVSLPGVGNIPLVGRDYRTRLYQLGEDGIAVQGF